MPSDSRIAKPEGFLKKEQLTEEMMNKIKTLNAIASKRDQSLAEMALAWIMRNPQITSVIIGASSVEQLKANLKAMENTDFNDTELLTIDKSL